MMRDNIRNRSILRSAALAALLTTTAPAWSQSGVQPWRIANRADATVSKFPLHEVTLLDGPFRQHMELNEQYLLKLDPDRLLYWHRKTVGLAPRAEHYGGWENGGSIALGHYLSACAMQYTSTGKAEFKKRIDHMVDELALCQQASGNGSLPGWPYMQAAFERIVKGDIQYKVEGPEFPFMNGGNPFYTIHKDMAGLRDAYLYTGNEKAKTVLIRFSDWVGTVVHALDEKTFQETLDVEHGGMSEVLADVYALTGEQKYMNLAERFIHKRVTDPIEKGQDILWPHHANAQVPKFVGYERIHQLKGNSAAYEHTISKNFYNMVLDHHTFVIGGNSEYERFGLPGQISRRIGVSSAETCNTYNMLKLAGQLYEKEGLSSYMDYFERALYNHILASHDPHGNFTYYVSLRPGHFKTFSTDYNSFWCCVGSGMENHTKYGDAIYAHAQNTVYVNLFIASKLDWKENGFQLQQETKFPDSHTTTLKVLKNLKGTSVKIRKPSWLQGQPSITRNGKAVNDFSISDNYIQLPGSWKKGDVVSITLPMGLRVENTVDNPHIGAFCYGPIVLAGTLGKKDLPAAAIHTEDAWANSNRHGATMTKIMTGDFTDLSSWIKPVKGKPLTFQVTSRDTVTLVPFYAVHDQRYAVYWDMYANEEWTAREANRKKQITDEVLIGDAESERKHALQSSESSVEQNALRSYRTASPGGSFTYTLQTDKQPSLAIMVTFWGSAWVKNPNGIVEILVDNVQIASHDMSNKDYQTLFYDAVFEVPAYLLQQKSQVNVTFRFVSNEVEGGIYHVRLCTPEGAMIPKLLTEQ